MKQLFLYMLLSIFNWSLAQSDWKDCTKLMDEYRDKMKKIDKPKEGQVYLMDMHYSFITPDSLISNRNNLDVKYYLTKDLSYYKSNKMDMYSDSKDFIIATHPNKSILWNNSIAKDSTWKDITKVGLKINDSLISYLKIAGCRTVEDKIHVTMAFTGDYQKKVKIKSVNYIFNKENRMLKKVVINYIPNSKMVRSEITYNKLDFNYAISENKTAREFVFENSSRLKKNYAGYKVIDNRSKK